MSANRENMHAILRPEDVGTPEYRDIRALDHMQGIGVTMFVIGLATIGQQMLEDLANHPGSVVAISVGAAIAVVGTSLLTAGHEMQGNSFNELNARRIHERFNSGAPDQSENPQTLS